LEESFISKIIPHLIKFNRVTLTKIKPILFNFPKEDQRNPIKLQENTLDKPHHSQINFCRYPRQTKYIKNFHKFAKIT
jgi:hypothetical protein